MDMFVDSWIRGFQIVYNFAKSEKYLVGILN